MKTSIILASVCATLAASKPLQNHEWSHSDGSVNGWWPSDWGFRSGWGPGAASAGSCSATAISTTISTTNAVAAVPTSTDRPAHTFHGGWRGHGSSAPAPASQDWPTTTTTSTTASPAATTGWGSSGGWGNSGGWGAAPSSSPSAAPSSGGGAPSSYAQSVLDQHNVHRANHSVPALTWSDDMASIAQQIAASCVYAHNTGVGGGGYGQNIGAGADESGVPGMITNEMYNGEIGWYPLPYGQENPSMTNFEHWGHFSQIVWKSTTSVGCYTQHCPGGLANVGGDVSPYFTVCNYSPPGNFGGEYGDNVLKPLGEPTVTA